MSNVLFSIQHSAFSTENCLRLIDLHLHTTASDGRLAPADLVALAASAGLTTISVTDHDTTAGLAEARAAAAPLGVRLIDGIEITAVEAGRDVHVLGYFFDPENAVLGSFLLAQRADRVRRVREISQRLALLGCAVDLDAILNQAESQPGRSIGRPRLADALVEAGHAQDRGDAFKRWLGAGRPGFVARRGPSVARVVEIVGAAGGITSLAHPGLTGIDDQIERFAASGLVALEARHSEQDLTTEIRYRHMASGMGLLVSGGSDFHADPPHHIGALGVVTLPPVDFAALDARAYGLRRRSSSVR
jgi:hypothetical protein